MLFRLGCLVGRDVLRAVFGLDGGVSVSGVGPRYCCKLGREKASTRAGIFGGVVGLRRLTGGCCGGLRGCGRCGSVVGGPIFCGRWMCVGGIRMFWVGISRLQSVFAVNRAMTVRFGHYKGKVRGSACRAIYSFLGEFNKSLFVKMLSSKAMRKIPRGTMPSVMGGFVGIVDGPALFSPAVCLMPRVVGCSRGEAVVRIRVPPDTRIRDFGGVVCSHISSTSIGIATADTVTRVCVQGRGVFAREGVCPCTGVRSLELSLLPGVHVVTRGRTNNRRP